MEKLIVAPQIVVYKNVFKNSKNLISILENDNSDSLFSKWEPWYEQGYRKNAFFDKNEKYDFSKKEVAYLKEIFDIFNLITKDYFKDCENGNWPSIVDWNQIKKEKSNINVDYFKYDLKKIGKRSKNDLLMEYHVDDYLLNDNIRAMRHAITINFYLNDEYSGGEICAYDDVSKKSYIYKPSPGDAVVIPSTEPFYHAVKLFDKYNRYFLRIFVDYLVEGDSNWKDFDKKRENYIKDDNQIIKIVDVEEIRV